MESKTIKRFEDLLAWQKARVLTKSIYQQTASGKFSRDCGLSDQLQRSAVSIMSNIAEGFERQSATEYIRFIIIAKSSCGELRSQLYTALDIGYISMELFKQLSDQAEEISRVLSGLKSSLLNKEAAMIYTFPFPLSSFS